MIFYYRITNKAGYSGPVVSRGSFLSRKDFLRCLGDWSRRFYTHLYEEVPHSCMKKLFPNAVWNAGESKSWPK